jgi:hypothetical protein
MVEPDLEGLPAVALYAVRSGLIGWALGLGYPEEAAIAVAEKVTMAGTMPPRSWPLFVAQFKLALDAQSAEMKQ